MITFKNFLAEKLVVYNGGKTSGQIVILAGGAASGKGFAVKNFIDPSSFKIIDVDMTKELLLKLAKSNDAYSELKNLDLKNPEDTRFLHKYAKDKNIDATRMDLLAKSIITATTKPNLLFDITFADQEKVKRIVSAADIMGYDKRNIHITWVLTDYNIAVNNNANRPRAVPEDILMQTHSGAALSMWDVLRFGAPNGLDGQIDIILNNPELTIYRSDTKIQKSVIKDFVYIRAKRSGQSIDSTAVMDQVKSWIQRYSPITP